MSRSVRAMILLVGLAGCLAILAGTRGSARVAASAPSGWLAGGETALDVPTKDLLPPIVDVSAATVHGSDDRIRVYPTVPYHRQIAYLDIDLEDGGSAGCTGTIVGARAVLTAAHCAAGDKGEPAATRIRVVPGKDGASEPWGSQYAESYRAPREWTELPDPDYNAYDFALLILPDTSLTSRTGIFPGPLAALTRAQLLAPTFEPTIAGYPADCLSDRCYQARTGSPLGGKYQWIASTRSFLAVEDGFLVSEIDTYGGNSGAVVIRNLDLTIVGVHSSSTQNYSIDIQLTSDILTVMSSWCAEKPGCSLNLATGAAPPTTAPRTTTVVPSANPPVWVNYLAYGSPGGGFYWDFTSGTVWTAQRGWHQFDPQPRPATRPDTLWVNHLTYGSAGAGFYLDPYSGQVWTAERGWHTFSPTGAVAPTATPSPRAVPPTPTTTSTPLPGATPPATATRTPTPTAIPTATATPSPTPLGPGGRSFTDGAYSVPAEVPRGNYRNTGGSFCTIYRNGATWDYGTGQFLVPVDSSWTQFRSTGCGTWAPSAPTGQKLTFGDGAYFVPAEVGPGSYRNTSATFCSIYWNASLYDYGSGQFLIGVPSDSGVLRVSGCGTWVRTSPTAPRTTFPDGAYFVPEEVSFGTYKNSGGSFCSIYRDRTLLDYGTGQFLVTVDSSWPSNGYSAVLRTTGCGTWVKQ